MDPLLSRIASRLLAGGPEAALTPSEARDLIRLPASATLDLLTVAGLARSVFKADAVFTCGISNAKSGRCPEDCAFCAQSAHYRTGAPIYPLQDETSLLRRAEALARSGAARFGIVASGTAPTEAELDRLCAAATRITREVDIQLCGSLGQLTPERAVRLRQAGFTSYHHNLETAASHFQAICTTHAYETDLETVRTARAAGFRVCSGGIFGLGESPEQRIELALTLADLEVDSIPINFLNPIPGTPLAETLPLSPGEALRSIALFRLLHPKRDILVCGGREKTLGTWQAWLFAAGANGMMTGNYLTTSGCSFADDNALLSTLGLRIEEDHVRP